jgi:chromosome segregation ATPase
MIVKELDGLREQNSDLVSKLEVRNQEIAELQRQLTMKEKACHELEANLRSVCPTPFTKRTHFNELY